MQSPILYNPSPTTLSHYLLSLEAIKGIGDRGMKSVVVGVGGGSYRSRSPVNREQWIALHA